MKADGVMFGEARAAWRAQPSDKSELRPVYTGDSQYGGAAHLETGGNRTCPTGEGQARPRAFPA
jgi:hypothetical protein